MRIDILPRAARRTPVIAFLFTPAYTRGGFSRRERFRLPSCAAFVEHHLNASILRLRIRGQTGSLLRHQRTRGEASLDVSAAAFCRGVR